MSDQREHLIDALRAHKSDYENGRTQDFRNVCWDCAAAADTIDALVAELHEEMECVALLRLRLEHLLMRETIRKYDEHDLKTRTYARDICLLDMQMEMLENLVAEAQATDDEPDVVAHDCGIDVPDVLYLCDRRKCSKCSTECMHTTDVRHAKNFELFGACDRLFVEREG